MVFKKFSVRHDRVAMKVGTDGVLLGAWASVEGVRTVLDIGTSSGLIALMMAQRTPEEVRIDAIEVADDAAQAKDNFEASPWKHRLSISHTSLQRYEPATLYDLIVTNPPYFINSLEPPDEKRKLVRHVITLNHADILEGADRMLHPTGRLSLILPPVEALGFEAEAKKHGLYCIRHCAFRTRPHKMPVRYLLEFSRQPSILSNSEICLYCKDDKPSADYRSLTADFYLNF